MTKSRYTAEIYEGQSGEFRWRLIAPNGEIIADSSESYTSRYNVRRALRTVAWAMMVCSVRGKK